MKLLASFLALALLLALAAPAHAYELNDLTEELVLAAEASNGLMEIWEMEMSPRLDEYIDHPDFRFEKSERNRRAFEVDYLLSLLRLQNTARTSPGTPVEVKKTVCREIKRLFRDHLSDKTARIMIMSTVAKKHKGTPLARLFLWLADTDITLEKIRKSVTTKGCATDD